MVQYSCPYCNKKFPSKRRLQQHIENEHVQSNPSPPPSPPSQDVELQPIETVESESKPTIESKIESKVEPVEQTIEPQREVSRIMEEELWVKASPIIRKVILDPKVFLYYDYVRNKYGYKGDLGDFIRDCVEDFFERRGIKIKIVEEEEL